MTNGCPDCQRLRRHIEMLRDRNAELELRSGRCTTARASSSNGERSARSPRAWMWYQRRTQFAAGSNQRRRGEQTMPDRLTFGAVIRRQRESAKIGLRELARRVGMSPTYLSKVETDQFRPPVEDKLVAIAKELKLDPDAVIARAGRVPSDVLETIKQHPVEMATLIRTAGQLAGNHDRQ